MYRSRFLDTFYPNSRYGLDGSPLALPDLGHDPLPVIRLLELQQRQTQFLHGFEGPSPEQVLRKCAREAFRDAIALRVPDVRRRTDDAQKGKLLQENVRDELVAMIVP
jgi:hypothetical protein